MLPASQKFTVGEKVKTALNNNEYEIVSFEGSQVNLKTTKQFIGEKEVPIISPTFQTYIDNLIKMETIEVLNTTLPTEKVEIQNATLQDNAYIPQSNSCITLDTVVPASMKYEMRAAIETIDRRVNGVDEYVAKKLGYCIDGCQPEQYKEGMSNLCKAFAAEQIDAIAVAIYNIEERGMGCIIGDQTGIGKGRDAAAMIRYAVLHGMKPVFLTQNPGLFSDMFRDIVDINFDPSIALERLVGYTEVERKLIKDSIEDEAAIAGIEMEEEAIVTEMVRVPDYQRNKYYEEDIKKALKETGVKQLTPFIVNGRSKYTSIRDKEGNILYKGLSQAETAKIISTLQIPDEYKFVVATYSQFRQKKETDKMRFLRSIAQGNVIVMDESHNASGDSNTGKYLREVLGLTKGVTFLSATFAKTPANMPIYANKTSMREANLSSEKLIEAIQAGGVALQEIVSSQLVHEGQMIRRERSFEGIEVNYMYLNSSQDESGTPQYNREAEHRAIMDKATEIVRDIILFQSDFVNPIIEKLDEIASAEQKEVEIRKGTVEAGVANTPVFNGIFQLVNQLLFSIKADAVAEMAINRIKQGKKPVIAFASTMESFLDNMTDDEGKSIQINDKINTDFVLILRKRLDGVMRYTIINSDGTKRYEKIKIEEQDIEFSVEYNRILEKIKIAAIGITSSPIDYIVQKIEKAGYSVGEVTGRKKYILLTEQGIGTVKTRQKESSTDLYRKFNENELDCLLVNISGAVGSSAHAVMTQKVKHDEVKQRVMIVLQAEGDVNMEVQKRGRINRTGQMFKPIYDYAISAIPAEMRLMMMLQRKLKSLDANVTSNQKESRKLLDVQDFLNKYGDQICAEYLQENPDINKIIGDPLKIKWSRASGADEKEKNVDTTNAAQRVTGRIAILSCKLQEEFYNEVNKKYISLIEYLKQTGEYDLEVENVNLEAKVIERQIVVVGLGGESMFGRNSILEKSEVNVLKKPFTKAELQAILLESLTITDTKGNDVQYTAEGMRDKIVQSYLRWAKNRIETLEQEENDWYDTLITDIKKEKAYQKLKTETQKNDFYNSRHKALKQSSVDSIELLHKSFLNKGQAITATLKTFLIGEVYAYPSRTYQFDKSYHKGIFLGFEIDETSKNPYSPTDVKLCFAFPNSLKYLAVPMSKFDIIALIKTITAESVSYNEQDYMIDEWNELRKTSAGDRRERYIVTGNILQAFGKDDFRGGKLISYTLQGGGVKKGILLAEDFSMEATKYKEAMRITIPAIKALKFIQRLSDGGSLETSDYNVSIQKRRDGYSMFIPLSKKRNEQYITNTSLIALTNEGRFEQSTYSRDKMVAIIDSKKLESLLEILQKTYGISFEISASLVASMAQEVDLGATEYTDEAKFQNSQEIILEKLTEEDRGFAETLNQQKFEADEIIRAAETQLESAKETQALQFDLDKRKLNVTKKMMHLVSLFVHEQVEVMRKGGTVKGKHTESQNGKVYQAMLEEAKVDKQWAEKKAKEVGREWKGASDVSRNMLYEYLDKPIEEMAREKYEYLYLRSHAKGTYNNFIDVPAKEKWEKLSGEKITMAKGGGVKEWEVNRNFVPHEVYFALEELDPRFVGTPIEITMLSDTKYKITNEGGVSINIEKSGKHNNEAIIYEWLSQTTDKKIGIYSKGGSIENWGNDGSTPSNNEDYNNLYEMFPDNHSEAQAIWNQLSEKQQYGFLNDLEVTDAASEHLVDSWLEFIKASSYDDWLENATNWDEMAKGGDIEKYLNVNHNFPQSFRADRHSTRAQKQYEKEVDAYKWFVTNPTTKKVESGFEFREDALDLKKDMQYPEQWVVLSARQLKEKGIENPIEKWKAL